MSLSDTEKISVLEYKVSALMLHVARLEAIVGTVIQAGNAPSFSEMSARLNQIFGVGLDGPVSENKLYEMLGSAPFKAPATVEDLRLT